MRNKITYLGQNYPIDLDKGLVGTLTDEEIERYSKMVNREKVDDDTGGNNFVFFHENYAIRFQRNEDNKFYYADKNLKNFLIGNNLFTNRLNDMQMQGLYFGEETEKPFLVMEKCDLVSYNQLTKNEKKRLDQEFEIRKKEIENKIGYIPSWDVWSGKNFKFDKTKKQGIFFDFDFWGTTNGIIIPHLNEQGELIC
ncbi:MAG TPA: hypothetical protein HA283_01165 [Nanoarchaeota archaeon]|nr:hypothetical protein [Nanoarchaeota archaeon]HIH62882.1 hypothetical protein [Nanoarchaeota archaeon]HIJ10299.1 hypothetical protein [Nanoarchaeota archaeon]